MNELPAEILRCQVDSLRDALVKVLGTRKTESSAWLASHNAKESTSDRGAHEEREHLAALDEMLNAEREARLLLATLLPKPGQQARELLDTKPDHLTQLLHFAEWERANNPPASGQKHIADWAYGEITRLRAGIEAALGEIELQRQDPGAFDYPATIAWEQASDAAAEIVRKHTGVTK